MDKAENELSLRDVNDENKGGFKGLKIYSGILCRYTGNGALVVIC
jgi:hypothetical protein